MTGLVFAAIAPHGSLAIPEACAPEERGVARATQEAMAELGHRLDSAQPDATIVLTPHNVHVGGAFAVVVAGSLAGSLADWSAESIELECPVDPELATQALLALGREGVPAVGVSFGGNDPMSAVAPMDWGTLIPLWFMGGRTDPPVPAVVVSPARDRSWAEHVRAGAALAQAATATGRRVALIASADHGHAHDPQGPYGYDPAAATYDARVVDLVRDGALERLLDFEPDLVEAAKADSFWQMLILQGATGNGWSSELLSYEAPTYFGMLCAAYVPES